MRNIYLSVILFLLTLFTAGTAFGDAAPVSEATQECLDCHSVFHPGIVADWQKSRHARVTPKAAMVVEENQRRMSSQNVPEALQGNSVGCAECHTLRGEAHADTFEHNGYEIHVVVSPDDCATCHAVEREQVERESVGPDVDVRCFPGLVDHRPHDFLARGIAQRVGNSILHGETSSE